MAAQPRRSSREKRAVKRLDNDAKFSCLHTQPKTLKAKKDITLYDVDVLEVDAVARRIKVHFKGYDSKYDEWQDFGDGSFPVVNYERNTTPDCTTIKERSLSFLEILYREIKKSLCVNRRDNPEVRIELPIDEDVFMDIFKDVGVSCPPLTKHCKRITDNNDVNDLLGKRWFCKVENRYGDFAAVSQGTARFWLMTRKPIQDFKLIGDRFFPYEIEQKPAFVFNYVKIIGNGRQYRELQSQG